VAGAPFTALCEQAAAAQGDSAPAWVAAALRRWVDDGLLCTPAEQAGAGTAAG